MSSVKIIHYCTMPHLGIVNSLESAVDLVRAAIPGKGVDRNCAVIDLRVAHVGRGRAEPVTGASSENLLCTNNKNCFEKGRLRGIKWEGV